MRILQVGNAQIRRFGKARVSNEPKLFNGLVRNYHHVLHFSDRDMAAFHAPFRLRDLGRGKANKKLIETAKNFRPEMILLGHCDIITNDTLRAIRQHLPEVRIAFRNVDPLFVPHNVEAIRQRIDIVDTIFITTAGKGLDQFRGKRATIHFIPNPVDLAIETLNNASRDDLPYDLFFCGNSTEHTRRMETVAFLREKLRPEEVRLETFGCFGNPSVWGHDYDEVLSKSRMGLNLNRQEGDFLYSSDRLAQLIGNGILAFIHRSSHLEALLGEERAVYFESNDDLLQKIREFAHDDVRRKAVAGEARQFYHEHFASEHVARYIVERTMKLPFSRDYIWADF